MQLLLTCVTYVQIIRGNTLMMSGGWWGGGVVSYLDLLRCYMRGRGVEPILDVPRPTFIFLPRCVKIKGSKVFVDLLLYNIVDYFDAST